MQFCDIDQPRLARIDSIVIIAGMHRRGRVAASVNPYPPNAGDGGARAATSFVANFKRSEDAEDEFGAAHVASLVDYAGRALDADSGGLARQARANRQQCRAKLLTDQRFRYFGTNPSRILSECETSDCLG